MLGTQALGAQALGPPAVRDLAPRTAPGPAGRNDGGANPSGLRVREPVSVGAATHREHGISDGRPGRWAEAGIGVRPSDADLRARIALLSEQLDLALSEVALCRAKYRQACDDDGADAPWLRSELDRLSLPRVARALSAELAALERVRLWAQELDGLHAQARTRSLLA